MPDLAAHHERIRRRGVNVPVYWACERCSSRSSRSTSASVATAGDTYRRTGPVILASNHRSFLDPFVIGCCVRRPVYFLAKRELFDNRLQGWILNALGAFPVRRGEADADALESARAILRRGDPVVIFPEGTRTRNGSLRMHRAAGSGGSRSRPVLRWCPWRCTGSERARRGWVIRPVRVAVRFGRPLTFPYVEGAVAASRRGGHRADLAVRRAAVGVARRIAAASARRRGGRRADGEGAGRPAGARGARGGARLQ